MLLEISQMGSVLSNSNSSTPSDDMHVSLSFDPSSVTVYLTLEQHKMEGFVASEKDEVFVLIETFVSNTVNGRHGDTCSNICLQACMSFLIVFSIIWKMKALISPRKVTGMLFIFLSTLLLFSIFSCCFAITKQA